MAVYSLSLAVAVPPVIAYPVRIAQGATDPVVWSFTDLNGNPVSMAGKSLSLKVYLDNGATQVTQFTHNTSSGLAIVQNQITWTPQSSDVSTAQILNYVLTDTTDNQELAWGVLSVFPV